MSILGGLWFPIDQLSRFLVDLAKVLPSYWVGQIGRDLVSGGSIPGQGVVVLAAWTVVMGAIAIWAYRRSGRRV